LSASSRQEMQTHRERQEAGEARRRVVARTTAAERNRFDELIRRFVEMVWTQWSPSVIC